MDKANVAEAVQTDLFERFIRIDLSKDTWVDDAENILRDRNGIIHLGAFLSRVLTEADMEAQDEQRIVTE